MKPANLFIIIILLINILGFPQDKSPDKIKGEKISLIDKQVPELMKKFSIPGLSLVVIKDAKIDISKSYGVKNVLTNEDVNDSTIFMAASLTKPVFAYLVLKLNDEGKINIDIPLYTYIPKRVLENYFIGHSMEKQGFNVERFKKITGRMVLSHSTGLPMYQATDPLDISFEPGTEFNYSPYGFGLLEIAIYCALPIDIEHYTGTELDDIMKKYVFDPLGMNNSSMIWQDKFRQNAVVGHNLFMKTSGKFFINKQASGASTLYTTIKDYSKLIIAIMNGEGLKNKTKSEMLSPQIQLAEKNNFWGLGVGLERQDNDYYFWQWGDYGLFKSFMLASNSKKDGVIFFANSYYGLCPTDDIVNITIGGKHPLFENSIMKNYVGPIKKWTHLFCMEDINKGIEQFNREKINNPSPISEPLITAIGNEYLNEQKFSEAISIFNLATETYPNSLDALNGLAESYTKIGNTQEARKNYQIIIQLNPDDKNAKSMLKKINSQD